jgi:hypothetical protein
MAVKFYPQIADTSPQELLHIARSPVMRRHEMERRYMACQHTLETTIVRLNEHYEGVITCGHCGTRKTVQLASHYFDAQSPSRDKKVKCVCGTIFHVQFDLRKYPRITVSLRGEIFQPGQKKKISDIMIKSLSVGGIGFETSSEMLFRKGDRLEVVFSLDDDTQAVIREEIVVKNVQKAFIGAEFAHKEKYNYELDFYLAPEN